MKKEKQVEELIEKRREPETASIDKETETVEAKPVVKPKKYTLRPYQQECVDILDKTPTGRHLVALATGLGKTVIFTHLKRNGRTLILSHRDELVRQPEKYYEGQCSFGVEKGNDYSNGEDVVSASVQTLYKDKRLARFNPDDFDTIIVDEAHHLVASNRSYQNIIHYFTGAKRIIGFTATPKRSDKIRLTDSFDDIIYQKDIRWGIKHGYLSHIRCLQVNGHYSLKDVKKDNFGDYSAKSVTDLFEENNGALTITAAKAYVKNCRDKHTLIYCVTTEHCVNLQQAIIKMLPAKDKDTIKVITGKTPQEERNKIQQDYMAGKVKAIINCMVLTEGTDLPVTDCIMNLRLTCNPSLFQQIVGRGTRLSQGKDYCLVIDIVPKDEDVQRSLCTAPTLFGIDPSRLSKEQKKKLNKNEDLMEVCDDWSNEIVEETKRIELEAEEIDLFVDGFKYLKRSLDTRELVRKFSDVQARWQPDEDDVDFGDLDVSVMPNENKKYRIRTDYWNHIYISEPDALDNVTVTFTDYYGVETSGQMKLKDAIDLIEKNCDNLEDRFIYCWSKKAQEEWSKQKATKAQLDKIKKTYKVETKNDEVLNKLIASKLIDYAKDYNEILPRKKDIEILKKGKNNFSTAEARDRFNLRYKLQKEMKNGNDIRFKQKVNAIEYKHKKEIEERQKEVKPRYWQSTPEANYNYFGKKASQKQLWFLEKLQSDLNAKNYHLETKTYIYDLTMLQATVLIDALIRVNNVVKKTDTPQTVYIRDYIQSIVDGRTLSTTKYLTVPSEMLRTKEGRENVKKMLEKASTH